MLPIRKWLWLIFGILAVSIGGYMLLFTPHTREVISLGVFLPKLFALIFMGLAVAFFPNTWKYKYILIVLLLFAFLVPYENALSWGWFGTYPDEAFEETFIPEFNQDRHYFINELWNAFYVMLFPSIIFGVSLAFRMGGGSTAKTLKIVFSGLLVYFSCLNIFIFQTIFHLRWGFPYSEVASWVYHVSYFLGRDPLMHELVYWFAAFMVLVVLLNLAPLDRWGERIGKKLGI
ncbi:MAG: hypothetical protein HXS41_07120 [Theionarchaea archaeon]|nr:hypothetical protein [Theionarchaea archaeon]MBU7000097.1 hypothetical protein [Theionarchaea archaeon]MBU7020814.1 hypothetical protein [Theionarchaea archaeon]MBU7033950.1 hypothetical protein [Theionarchaea archaeon]MBU7039246.1 hypothetical protein [Theionarchaea archaeon]